mmetsp:Transcript_25607/g.48811  ORF Transcript_25607/g.48811 Transcript_25607/m.48811 type:complete len:306 (+) Transcript_25607:151-1068(+)
MERSSGLVHRPANQSLPTTESNKSTMNPLSRRRHLVPTGPSANRNAILHLAILAMITIFAVLAIFVKLIPAKASLKSSSKLLSSKALVSAACPHGEERTWHGGHPVEDRPGSCWCGADEYCMCTPSVAIDIVLYSTSKKDEHSVWVVRRGDTGQLATIGGFVDVGETTENAVLREAEEETGIIIPPERADAAMKLIGVYSDPRRDNRRHIVSVAYALEFQSSSMTTKDGTGVPKGGDDAKEVIVVPLEEIGVKFKGEDWYADHLTILLDFKEQMMAKTTAKAVVREGEIYEDVARARCEGVAEEV